MPESPPTRGRGLKPYGAAPPVAPAVAPHAGAWIETSRHGRAGASRVAPHAGAWIETRVVGSLAVSHVAPHAGAWIETT